MRRINGPVLFDIDDTLLDHSKAERQAILVLRNRYSDLCKLSDAKCVQIWRQISGRCYDKFVSGKMTITEQRRTRVFTLFASVDVVLTEILTVFHF